MIAVLVSTLLLVLVYALVLNSFAWPDLLIGTFLAGALLCATRGYLFSHEADSHRQKGRLSALAPFILAILKEIATSTWRVLLISLRLRPLKRAGIVTIPMGERSDWGVTVTTFVMTFTPGSVLIDVDWEGREMLFHVMDATNPDEVRDSFDRFYQRYQRPIFP